MVIKFSIRNPGNCATLGGYKKQSTGADLGKNYAGDFCENIVTLRGRTMVAAEERFLINGHPR